MSKIVHMLIGGIGTGKSTFAKQLSKKDNIRIISGDDIQDRHKKLSNSKVDEIITKLLDESFLRDKSFIIDGKLLNPQCRRSLVAKAKERGYKAYGYDFGKGSIFSLLRRLREPRRFTAEDWEQVYQSDLNSFSTPELNEGFDKIFYPPK